ncbi:hypothetical protein AB5I41_20560 [Sphingomonas sp. MMS24-JH45]
MPDSRQVLFVQDKGGDENFLLYGVDVANGAPEDAELRSKRHASCRSDPAKRSRIASWSASTTAIRAGTTSTSPILATGQLTKVFQNEGYAGFVTDDQLKVRVAQKTRPDGGSDFYRVNGTTVEAKPFATVTYEDGGSTYPLGFTTDGRTLDRADARGRDTSALVAQDVATGKTTVVGQDAKAGNVGGGLFNPRTGQVEAYGVNYLRNEYVPVGTAIAADLKFLKDQDKGQFFVGSRTDADDKWLVTYDGVSSPSATYLGTHSQGAQTHAALRQPARAGGCAAGADAGRGDPDARRPDHGELPHRPCPRAPTRTATARRTGRCR